MWKYLSNFLQLWPVAKQWPFCYHGNITRLRRAAGTNLLTRHGPQDHVCSQGQPFSHAVWFYQKGLGPPEGDFLGKTAIQCLTDEICCGFTFTSIPTLLCEVGRVQGEWARGVAVSFFSTRPMEWIKDSDASGNKSNRKPLPQRRGGYRNDFPIINLESQSRGHLDRTTYYATVVQSTATIPFVIGYTTHICMSSCYAFLRHILVFRWYMVVLQGTQLWGRGECVILNDVCQQPDST